MNNSKIIVLLTVLCLLYTSEATSSLLRERAPATNGRPQRYGKTIWKNSKDTGFMWTDKKPYKYGITALYKGLNVPCLPVAVNTGYFWPRRKFLRYPGKMVIEFLKPIEPGMDPEDFSAILKRTIEKRSNELVLEAQNQSTGKV